MSLFLTFESFSAQASSPEELCNPFLKNSDTMKIEIGFGLIMILITLLYITFGIIENSSKMMKVGSNADATSGVLQGNVKNENEEKND